MKLLLNLLLVFFIGLPILIGQKSGVIEYQETMKMDIQFEGMIDESMADLIPTSRTVNMYLQFKGDKSLYKEGKNENTDQEINSDDGAIRIVIATSDVEDILFIDHANKRIVNQSGFMGKSFLIKDKLPKLTWKISTDKVSYLDHVCFKATTIDENGEPVVAWFAPDLHPSIGPGLYGQLPGAILMLSVGGDKREIKAMNIALKDIDNIEEPNEGKVVTEEEFDKIMDEKMKEMEMEHGDGEFIIKRH